MLTKGLAYRYSRLGKERQPSLLVPSQAWGGVLCRCFIDIGHVMFSRKISCYLFVIYKGICR